MRLLELLFGLLSVLCCSVLASPDLDDASSSSGYGIWFWTKIVLIVVYIALGALLYRDRGTSRVFMLYIGLGALCTLIGILASIDWSSNSSSSPIDVMRSYQAFSGSKLIGQSVTLNGLIGEDAQYNEADAYVQSYNKLKDTYTATVSGGILSFFARHEITGLKRINMGLYALLVTRVKRAQQAVDSRMRETEDATKAIALKEAQMEDRKRDMETFKLVFERKEYTVGTRVTYAGKNGKVAAVKETPLGKRYTVTLTNWYGGSTGEVEDVDISKLPLKDSVSAASNLKESKRKFDASRMSLDSAKSTKARFEASLRDLEVKLTEEEKLSSLERARQAKARAYAHSHNVIRK